MSHIAILDGLGIKRCLFCGQQPELDDPDCVHPVTRPDKNGRQLWRAGCTSGMCGAQVLGDSALDALNRWNTRYVE